MAKWTVKEATQVAHGDVLYAAGETFSAEQDEITAEGLTPYVTKVEEKAPEPEKAKPAAPNKARKASPNKARKASPNKARKASPNKSK